MFRAADAAYRNMKDAELELKKAMGTIKNIQSKNVMMKNIKKYTRYMNLYKIWEEREEHLNK